MRRGGRLMGLILRPATAGEAFAIGHMMHPAFKGIANRHGFPPDFPSPEIAMGRAARLLSNPGFYSVVVERDGRIVGRNFLDLRGAIGGIGPITVYSTTEDQ